MSKFKQKSVGWHRPEDKLASALDDKVLARRELPEFDTETLDIDRVWWIGLPRKPDAKKSWF